jgi:hypothetical protein
MSNIMRFALNLNLIDVICDNSLRNTYAGGKVNGFSFDIRLNYYRGHFLSVIDEFTVKVDGKEMSLEKIRFHLNEKNFGLCELKECYSEFWNILDPATITVEQPQGLDAGCHEIDVTLFFRSPYMAIGPDHQYMPVNSCGSKKLVLSA